MSAAPQRVGIQPGEGVVARFGDALTVVASDALDQPFFPALFDVLKGAGSEPVKASKLAWRVAALLTEHEPDVAGFGIAVPVAEGYLVMVHGPVRALIADGSGDVELNGAEARTWVDRVVAAPVERLALTLAASGPVEALARSQLDSGVIPAGGLVLMSPTAVASAPAGSPAPAARSPLPAAPETPAGSPPGPEAAPEVAPEAAPPPPPAEPEPAPASRPMTPVRRANETMVVQSWAGALVADDGTRTVLDRNYVFGREPWKDPDVVSGAASPIVVKDPDNLISRAHAYVTVDAGGVMVRDNASGNGTYVAPPGAPEWMRLGPHPAPLPPGWSLRLGMRVFTHIAAATEGESAAR
jgi:hypothetical protein